MRVLLSIIFSTLGAVANVSVVLIIIVYICAIIGMQLFGENYTPANFPDGVPRWNFVDFPHSIMLVFRILCGEWIEPLYDCMNCSNTGLCILVFITTLMVGNILVSICLMNLTFCDILDMEGNYLSFHRILRISPTRVRSGNRQIRPMFTGVEMTT